MNKWFICACVMLLVCSQSCKIRQQGAVSKVEVANMNFHYFSSKAKVKYSDENEALGFSVSIRICQDSLIWLNASKSNVSIMRAKIEKDTVRFIVINPKKAKGYYRYSYKELSQKAGFELNYSMLEGIILGNKPLAQSSSDVVSEIDGATVLSQQRGDFVVKNTIDSEGARMIALEVKQNNSQNGLSINYDQFELAEAHTFPHHFDMDVTVEIDSIISKMNVDFMHSKVKFPNTLSMPFKVPSSYQERH